MRAQILIGVFLVGAFAASAQDTSTPQPGQIKDPRAILAAAAPFYDFSDPALKPFHLKATYQLYDEKGNPSEQGIFEYWWASPQVHRTTWTRPSASRTDWHTADGKQAYVATGEDLGYFERGLWSELFSPLPSEKSTDPSKTVLVRNNFKLGNAEFICVSQEPVKPFEGLQPSSFRAFPTECFDSAVPVLRVGFSGDGAVGIAYDNIAKFQGKFMARAIQEVVGQQKLFSMSVESIDTLSPTDPSLVPPANATFKPDPVAHAKDAEPELLKKKMPIYPPTAKLQRLQGAVIIDAIVGTDGTVKNPHVIASPSPLLSDAALQAVSKWEYKPYLENGIPTEAGILIVVIFRLGI